MLLFSCAKAALGDKALQTTCCRVFEADECVCVLGWKLHKLDIDTDGSVVNKLEGAGGRIDYHIVAACSFGDKVVYHDVGYIYHTTNWRQNTYHAQAPSPDCTRALVVCGNKSLVNAFRHAVAAAWLALSGNAGPHSFCVFKRAQAHPDEVSNSAPDTDASVVVQSLAWDFPELPLAGVSEESNTIVENIVRQCRLICPPTSSQNEKRKMLKGFLVLWHPDTAVFFNRCDIRVCSEVTVFLPSLLDRLTLG